MLVQSLEQLKKRTLSKRVSIVAGEKNFLKNYPRLLIR